MQTYVLTIDCETCGAQMRSHYVDLSAESDTEPVIDIDMAVSQAVFECHNCGGITYTGDFDDMCMHEPGEEPKDEEE